MSQELESEPRSLVLLTELFPPFVGGSALLFENIYSRLKDCQTLVLTDGERSPDSDEGVGPLSIQRTRLRNEHWGIMRPSAQLHHLRVARHLWGASRTASAVHCARTLPEGLPAMICRMWGGPPFACWAHGEDLTMQVHTSRELRLLTKLICRAADRLFANSRFTAGLITDFGIPREKVFVINPGVEIDRFNPTVDGSSIRQQYARPGQSLLLSVGRLQRRKGFDLVVEAMARLTTEGTDVRYVMVGDGPDFRYLAELVDRHRLKDRISMVGKISDELLPQYYAACDVFVHPNRVDGVDVEGFGLVFLEAAASGKPSIGGASGGVPEALLDGQTGNLVSGTDAEELAGAIKKLIDTPHEAARLGNAGRKRVIEEFSWDRVAARMSVAIQDLGGAA